MARGLVAALVGAMVGVAMGPAVSCRLVAYRTGVGVAFARESRLFKAPLAPNWELAVVADRVASRDGIAALQASCMSVNDWLASVRWVAS